MYEMTVKETPNVLAGCDDLVASLANLPGSMQLVLFRIEVEELLLLQVSLSHLLLADVVDLGCWAGRLR